MSPPIYASDPNALPDAEFAPGALEHLVAGNRGRLLDARRTPIIVVGVRPEVGSFEIELGAFEDAGARWELSLSEIDHFQFERDASRVDADTAHRLQRALEHFDRVVAIDCPPGAAEWTRRRIATERARVREWVGRRGGWPSIDLDECIERRRGAEPLFALLGGLMTELGVAELESTFTKTLVSNPRSGEVVKGHAIVIAELGLHPYEGQAPRSPDLFRGTWSKSRRADHLIARLAFVRELFACLGLQQVTLFRGAAIEPGASRRSPSSFVSATFSSAVAQEHFEGGAATETSLLWRGPIPRDRLLMTFLETEAMNAQFGEAEALLIAQ